MVYPRLLVHNALQQQKRKGTPVHCVGGRVGFLQDLFSVSTSFSCDTDVHEHANAQEL